ncbi:30S ribosomal protein S12 methylthiotransferase accessory factor YcaO [Neptunomonas antarctica]|uniref:Ribosomal protein S12 methylthiotransferase accessory factor n=1 Tax=Neptunomonas antarctica TaxID=619304 RepID=A0A1N7KEK8_9GAMM|nr:30S ribosomal protein S12 methylthiotransferase accessory factor YcaO [Neptunomonas antarctica]SIS59949.1 ribosomal protein S12 methylthiotransferase accessory factor [Neptunomonas antarctica]
MTCITGKDVPLEDSIEKMSGLLLTLGFEIEEINWLNPVPNVWSVHMRDKNCPMLFTNGKGATKEAARASALGEYFEQLSCNYFFADFYLGKNVSTGDFVHYPNERWFPVSSDEIPKGLLDEATLSHYNMDDELTASMLIDTNSGNRERGICALPFIKQKTKEEIWFPVNIIGNLYASNGMAAGNTLNEARVQAISEIFERHIKNTIISSGISLPKIPDEVINRYPKMTEAIAALRQHGFIVYVLDASLGGKFPLVNVTLMNPEDGGCFASFGAHPKFEVALEKAVTELLQGRALNQLEHFSEPSFDLQLVAEQHNLETHFIDSSGLVSWELLSSDTDYEFADWNMEGDSKEEFEHLCHLIHKVDMDIYIADYEHLGVYCCRVIVPGMSEVYPVETLVRNNNNLGIGMRSRIMSIATLSDHVLEELYQEIGKKGLDDQQLISELIGITPDSGSGFDGLRVVELKYLIALRLQHLKVALACGNGLLQFACLNKERARLYRCLHQLLQFSLLEDGDVESFVHVLNDLYGAEQVSRCQAMLKGEGVFESLISIDAELGPLQTHTSLLMAYQRLQSAKI